MEEDAPAVTEEPTHEEQPETKPEEPTAPEPQEEKVKPKPKGHRLKDPNKEVLTEKTNCDDCNQTISKHTKRYTHKCPAKKAQVTVEAIHEPMQEVVDTPASSSHEPAPKPRRAPAQPPRRLLDLDAIDHNDPEVHYVVSKYMSSMRETMHQQKVDRYRNLLTGKL